MKLEHTPGPWEVTKNLKGEPLIVSKSKEVNPYIYGICTFRTSDCWFLLEAGQEEANKRLIASAPEMLEALIKATKEMMNETYNASSPTFGHDRAVEDSIEANIEYLDVIEKATGKTYAELQEDV